MSTNPFNLALRFILEILALVAMGSWGWRQHQGWLAVVLMLALPAAAAFAWGTFRKPGDRANSGRAPVPVPGAIRLALELAFFSSAIAALEGSGRHTLALTFAAVVVLHHVTSWDRLLWLLGRRPPP